MTTTAETGTQQAKNLFGLLTPQQLAEQLGVTVRTLQLWQVKRTGPPVVQAGRQVYYRVASVESWLASRERRNRSDTSPASGSSASIEAVIYMRRSTTEKQVEGFRSSVLEPKNEIPSFVSSYELLSPNQANGHWAIVITFRDKSRRGEVAGYVERIKRDGRVDYVKMSVGPSKKHP